MRVSQYFLSTLKEAPSEAELVSHRLMLRAGLIKRLASGLYSWMPLGLRVLRKVEAIIRQEMDKSGAVELLMTAVQPAELWQESGRWDMYGPELLRIKDRHQRDFCFGPTHEEVITDIVRREIKSYRQLPVNFYQIQTKFRDEIRPRFGVIRAREFVMKDAYSFHPDKASLGRTYQLMYDTYSRIFTRLGLKFRAVAAATGTIGGTISHEFHVLAESGEDAIAFCPNSNYAANVQLAEALAPEVARGAPRQTMEKVATPGKKTCKEVSDLLELPLARTVKSLLVACDQRMYMLLVRGDHALNETKTQNIPGLNRFRFATDKEILAATGCPPGYIGPVGLDPNIVTIADRSVAAMSDFICGANANDYHLIGVNFGRDLPEPSTVADIRNVVLGDRSPDGKGLLEICRGIEVGHVFQLGTKYSEAMDAKFLDENGQTRAMEMGCYGIGVSRIVAAAIEQNNDQHGIVFPQAMAPFQLAIVPAGTSAGVRAESERMHDELSACGIEVLLDDRDERPGVMFADMELIGIPHRLVVGERALRQGAVEYQERRNGEMRIIPLQNCVTFIKSQLCAY